MQKTASTGAGDLVKGAATSLDEHGKRLWEETGLQSEGNRRRAGHVASAIVNLVLLCVVSSPLVWSIPFLTSAFVAPLAIIQLSLAATTAAELAFLAYDEAWFRHLVRLGLSVIAFAATYTLLNVFPFEFPTEIWSDAMRLALVVALVGIVIGAVVEAIQLLFGWVRS